MKIYIDYEKLRNLFFEGSCDSYDNNLFGSQGFCLVRGNLIYKIYFDPKRIEYDFTKYKSDKIAFPIRYLRDKKNLSNGIVGEIMQYYEKKSITWSIDESVNIELLIKHYLDIRREILRYPNIEMIDLCSPNILYNDENGFSLIDTTKWIINNEEGFDKYNNRLLDFWLCERIICEILEISSRTLDDRCFYKNLKKYGKLGCKLFDTISLYLDDTNYEILAVLELLKEIALNNNIKAINTLEDAQNYIKTLKNS